MWFACPKQALHHRLCHAAACEDFAEADLQMFTSCKRLGALQGLNAMYSVLGDAALSHVAEALPIVSELMEDADLNVRREALQVMVQLEAVGELDCS